MKKKIVGFFGGSFDPIHFGHITLAIELMEEHALDEVLFCPAYCSPFKTDKPPVAGPKDRLAMLKLALEIPPFKITSWELDREGPSYTIDTIRALQTEGVQYRLLLSNEAAKDLKQWKEVEALVRLAPPLIGERKTPISSTQIRERLQKNLYCGHLIPAKVLEYIRKHDLY
jgi:nicotinate-nucleotide adenylyltransferase